LNNQTSATAVAVLHEVALGVVAQQQARMLHVDRYTDLLVP
jgi:hypothetical protein